MQSVISSAPMEEKTMTFIGLFMPCIYNRIVIIRVNNIFVKIEHFIRRKLIPIELYTYGTLPTFSKPNLTKIIIIIIIGLVLKRSGTHMQYKTT